MLAVEGLTEQSSQKDVLKPSIILSLFSAYFKIFQQFHIALKVKIYISLYAACFLNS